MTALFGSAGTLVMLVTLWTAFQPSLRDFSESLTAKPPEEPVKFQAGEEASIG